MFVPRSLLSPAFSNPNISFHKNKNLLIVYLNKKSKRTHFDLMSEGRPGRTLLILLHAQGSQTTQKQQQDDKQEALRRLFISGRRRLGWLGGRRRKIILGTGWQA